MPRVLSGLMFFPRGGSAAVARALARRLPQHGWETTVLAGSLPGHGDAAAYYGDLDVRPAHFAPYGPVPMHPSYEDRQEGAEGSVFATVDDESYERHVTAWAQQLDAAGARDADVLHLHHLTPLHEAAARVAPDVPVVGHLHGTELLMLEQIAAGPPSSWAHAEAWERRMRRWARRCRVLLVPSRAQLPRAERLLGIERERCVVLPNGVDLDLFSPRAADRVRHWRRHLSEQPRGWAPGEEEGSVRYDVEEAQRVACSAVALYVGRFTAVKRLGLLIEAWADARERLDAPASLVIVGGHPGEWEGEHPLEAVRRTAAPDVYLAGWHPQEALPAFLHASDLLVLPSVREQFGLVVVEAMACGVPPLAVDAFGPAEIVDPGRTGWLVPPDDREALAAALVEALGDEDERRTRGHAAREAAVERYGWEAVASRLAEVLEQARSAYAPAHVPQHPDPARRRPAGDRGRGAGRGPEVRAQDQRRDDAAGTR